MRCLLRSATWCSLTKRELMQLAPVVLVPARSFSSYVCCTVVWRSGAAMSRLHTPSHLKSLFGSISDLDAFERESLKANAQRVGFHDDVDEGSRMAAIRRKTASSDGRYAPVVFGNSSVVPTLQCSVSLLVTMAKCL